MSVTISQMCIFVNHLRFSVQLLIVAWLLAHSLWMSWPFSAARRLHYNCLMAGRISMFLTASALSHLLAELINVQDRCGTRCRALHLEELFHRTNSNIDCSSSSVTWTSSMLRLTSVASHDEVHVTAGARYVSWWSPCYCSRSLRLLVKSMFYCSGGLRLLMKSLLLLACVTSLGEVHIPAHARYVSWWSQCNFWRVLPLLVKSMLLLARVTSL